MTDETELVTVTSHLKKDEADRIIGILNSARINAIVSGHDAASRYNSLYYQIRVKREDFKPAKQIIDKEKAKITAFLGLACYNNDKVDAITRARGFMEFYERYNPNKGLIDSALRYLESDRETENKAKQNRDFIRAYFILMQYNKVIEYARHLKADNITDAWTAYRIGEAYYQQRQTELAMQWYQRAVTIWPYALDFQNKYGSSQLAMGNMADAKKTFEFIVNENPRYAPAHVALGYLYMQDKNIAMAYDHLSKALLYEPDNKQGLINMAVWYHTTGQDDKAKKTLQHLLKKYPDNEQGKAMLLDLV